MAVSAQYQADVNALLAMRHDNGADLWATPDKRLMKGSPFTTLESALLLLELGMPPSDPLLLFYANGWHTVSGRSGLQRQCFTATRDQQVV